VSSRWSCSWATRARRAFPGRHGVPGSWRVSLRGVARMHARPAGAFAALRGWYRIDSANDRFRTIHGRAAARHCTVSIAESSSSPPLLLSDGRRMS